MVSLRETTTAVQSQPQKPLAGFEQVVRHWDSRLKAVAAKIGPGEYYATLHDEVIFTVLGSCVAACVRDRVFGLGGMNHFMLPLGAETEVSSSDCRFGDGARYGNYAMELLVNTLMRQGAQRRNLEVKLFGGGRVLNMATDVGRRNIEFVKDYVRSEGLNVVAEDLGGPWPRKVLYYPSTGLARVKRLSAAEDAVVEQESRYLSEIRKPPECTIELF